MPLSTPKRKISDPENKLRVLFCLNALGMATQEQLWPFVAQLELMEYVPFCLYVDELRSDGAVAAASHALEGALYLTAQGHQQLELFAGRLPHADRERITMAAPAYTAQMSARRLTRCAYESAADGVCRAACTLSEGDVPTLLLRIASEDCELVNRAVKRFRGCAAQVLTLLYTWAFRPFEGDTPQALSQEQALADVQPGKPQLCAYGGRECAAVVSAQQEAIQYTILVLLPDERLAWGWALAADAARSQLARRVTALFEACVEDA